MCLAAIKIAFPTSGEGSDASLLKPGQFAWVATNRGATGAISFRCQGAAAAAHRVVAHYGGGTHGRFQHPGPSLPAPAPCGSNSAFGVKITVGGISKDPVPQGAPRDYSFSLEVSAADAARPGLVNAVKDALSTIVKDPVIASLTTDVGMVKSLLHARHRGVEKEPADWNALTQRKTYGRPGGIPLRFKDSTQIGYCWIRGEYGVDPATRNQFGLRPFCLHRYAECPHEGGCRPKPQPPRMTRGANQESTLLAAIATMSKTAAGPFIA